MHTQTQDHTDVLQRIEHKLERLEKLHNGRTVNNAELVRLMLKVRNEGYKMFPEAYFPAAAWDMLLVLYDAFSEREKLNLEDICNRTSLKPSTAIRYIDILMQDGLVFVEGHASADQTGKVLLTQSGTSRLTQILESATKF